MPPQECNQRRPTTTPTPTREAPPRRRTPRGGSQGRIRRALRAVNLRLGGGACPLPEPKAKALPTRPRRQCRRIWGAARRLQRVASEMVPLLSARVASSVARLQSVRMPTRGIAPLWRIPRRHDSCSRSGADHLARTTFASARAARGALDGKGCAMTMNPGAIGSLEVDLGGLEWLATNQRGSFALGSADRVPRRKYHSLLTARGAQDHEALDVLLEVEEWVEHEGVWHGLHALDWGEGKVEPRGDRLLRSFGPGPRWVYELWPLRITRVVALLADTVERCTEGVAGRRRQRHSLSMPSRQPKSKACRSRSRNCRSRSTISGRSRPRRPGGWRSHPPSDPATTRCG